MNALTSDLSHVFNPILKGDFIKMVRGEGIYLYDDQGNEYLDASGGPILNSLGYGVKEMAEVLHEQSARLNFAYRLYATTDAHESACRYIYELSDNLLYKTFLVSGGTEGVEMAIKLAKVFHKDNGSAKKHKVIGTWLSYHGMTNAALSWGGSLQKRQIYSEYIDASPHIPPSYCYRCWYAKTPNCCNLECAKALENEILTQGAENVSAFITEPISGSSLCGAFPQKDGYFEEIRRICDKYDVLLIIDEVLSGFGRTGKWFGYQHYNVKPDIVCMGKAISGGYFPAGGFGCTKKIFDVIADNSGLFMGGYSWSGNPMAAAVISKSIEYKREHNLLENVNTVGSYLGERLKSLMDKHPTIGDVRGRGLLWGIEFVKDKETKECFKASEHYYIDVVTACKDNKMLVQFGSGNDKGIDGDMILIGPSFIITKNQVDELVAKLDKSLCSVEAKYSK